MYTAIMLCEYMLFEYVLHGLIVWSTILKQTVLHGRWGQEVGVSGGSEVFGDDNTRNRLGKALKVIGALSEPVWKQEELSRKTKVKAYVIVVPSLIYGCGTLVLNEQQESAGQATEMRALRRIVEKSRVGRARNVGISKELRHEVVLEKVRRSQWRWRDALAERGPERLVK